ncbi:hypothetical protein FOXYSP1_20399 [Fusarium oxysporum f. sp. phaseoli]
MLLCRLCKSAVRPGTSIESHFRHEHQLKGKVLKDIKDYYGSMELADLKFAELPQDGSVAVELLDIFSGYSCAACRYYTVARDNTIRHWREAGHGTAEIRWTEVQLQTWIGGKHDAPCPTSKAWRGG